MNGDGSVPLRAQPGDAGGTAAGRIVVLRLSALGDVVHGIGAVQALREALPQAAVTWVVQRPLAPLLAGVAEVLPHDRHGGVRAWLATARAIRRLRPDVVLDLQGNWKSAGLQWLSGAPRRIGAAAALRRERSSARCSNELVGLPAQAVAHPAAVAHALVRALAPAVAERPPRLAADAAEIEREARALAGLGIDPAAPFEVLVPGRRGDPRSWPAAAVVRHFAAARGPVVGLLGPAERGRLAPVRTPSGRTLPVLEHARGELRRLVAFGALCARAGARVIGPDQGACHVLSACGATVVVLYGPTDAARTGPPGAAALRAAGGPSCAPCWPRACHNPCGPICMDYTPAEAGAAARGPLLPAAGEPMTTPS